jgi:predicted phage-related endonuclease
MDPQKRLNRIGSTQIAGILGYDPRRDRYSTWAEILGYARPEVSPEQSDQMLLGKCLERGIADYYSRKTKRQIEWCDETRVHPTRPYMAGTPDALVVGEPRGLDCKHINSFQGGEWGEDVDHIPPHIQLQMWWFLSLLDYRFWDVVAVVGGLCRIYTIERDLAAERVMLAAAEEFYERFIIGDREPAPGPTAATTHYLQQRFAKPKPQIREATHDEIAILENYATLRNQRDALKPQLLQAENTLRRACADLDGIKWEHGRFTWKRIKDSRKTDWHSIAIGLLTNYEVPAEKQEELIEIHTNIKEGYRKIRFVSDLCEDEEAADAA